MKDSLGNQDALYNRFFYNTYAIYFLVVTWHSCHLRSHYLTSSPNSSLQIHTLSLLSFSWHSPAQSVQLHRPAKSNLCRLEAAHLPFNMTLLSLHLALHRKKGTKSLVRTRMVFECFVDQLERLIRLLGAALTVQMTKDGNADTKT